MIVSVWVIGVLAIIIVGFLLAVLTLTIRLSLSQVRHLDDQLKELKEQIQKGNSVDTVIRSLGEIEGRIKSLVEQANPKVDQIPSLKDDVKRIEKNVDYLTQLLGGRKSGRAAEQLVENLLEVLPQGWIEQKVKMGKGEVEFAIPLPGRFFVPLDSKFVENIEDEAEVERKVQQRAREVGKYLNDEKSAGFGIAAVPDSAYTVCRRAMQKVAKDHSIVIVPYSLLVPYVLSLYLIAHKLGVSVDSSDLTQRVRQAYDAVNHAMKKLGNMENEVKAVNNQRVEALGNLENACRSLKSLLGEEPSPPEPLGEAENPLL